MIIDLRISPALRKRIKKNAKAEGMTISDWVIWSVEEVLRARKFKGLVDIECVEEMLTENNDRQGVVFDEKLLERIDRAAQRKKMNRSDFILMSVILHADRSLDLPKRSRSESFKSQQNEM